MEICSVDLVADGPSHSAENSATSPVIGAADVSASSGGTTVTMWIIHVK